MKKLFTLLAFVTTITIFAQAPQGFNYQATLRNSAGALIVSQNVLVKFNVLQNSVNGTIVYSENQSANTDDLGHINLVVGKGTPTTGTFSAINWGSGSYYLEIELNIGSGYVAMGTTQLLSVPYALYAEKSGSSATPATNGLNALIKTTVESAGANCTTGGTKIEVGLDTNKNGVLDDSEVNATQTKYVCNGAQGATWPASSSIGANAAFSNAISTYYKPLESMTFKLSSNGKYIIFGNPNYAYTIGTTRYSSVGEVYVMKYENGIFEQVGQKIQGVVANDYLGGSVGISMDGMTILLTYNDNNTQKTKIFKFVNNSWVLHSTIQAVGLTLSNDGNVLTGTIWTGNNSAPVVVDVYRLNGTNWDKSQFTATDILGYADGFKISADGNTIALANSGQNGIGRIAIYKYINNAWGRIGNYIDGTLELRIMNNGFDLSKDGQKIVFSTYPLTQYGNVSFPLQVKAYTFDNNNWIRYGNDIEFPANSTYLSVPFLSFNITSDALLIAVNNDGADGYVSSGSTIKTKDFFTIFKFTNGNWNQYGSRIDISGGFTNVSFNFESNIFMFLDTDYLIKIKDYN